MIGLLSGGHILLEGLPGLAKTLAVKTLARAIQTDFRRIQFTPDMLPADIIGTEIYNPQETTFEVKQGPIFSSLILADEINRAPAKVQSALLEAMQEKQVTIGEQSFQLPELFLVLATQNPIEQEGTYPLPEAQVDRFMLKVVVDYPSREEERRILDRFDRTGRRDGRRPGDQPRRYLRCAKGREQHLYGWQDQGLHRFLGLRHPRAGELPARAEGVHRDRRLAPGDHQPQGRRPLPRLSGRPGLRDAGRRQSGGHGRHAPPAADQLRGGGRGHQQRGHHQQDPRYGPGPLSAEDQTMDVQLTREILKKVRQIEVRTNRLVNDSLAGSYHSVFKGRGMNFDEVREYVPGDDIRAIDWNVTARTGIPHIKKFTEERELTIMLMIDISGSGDFGSATGSKRELMAEVGSVLAFSAVRNNDKVGLVLFTDFVELYIPPKKGRGHILRIIREILYFQPQGRRTDLQRGPRLHQPGGQKKMRGLSHLRFLPARRFRPRPCSELRPKLQISNRRHDLIGVIVSDPREFELPDVGWLTLEDAESGDQVELNTGDAGDQETLPRDGRRAAQNAGEGAFARPASTCSIS